MFCTKCGKKIPDGAEFCTGCGTRVKDSEKDNGNTTPTLNNKIASIGNSLGNKTPIIVTAVITCLVIGIIVFIASKRNSAENMDKGVASVMASSHSIASSAAPSRSQPSSRASEFSSSQANNNSSPEPSRNNSSEYNQENHILEDFGIDPNAKEEYSANLDFEDYLFYQSGIGKYHFSYPAYYYNDVKVDDNKYMTEYGENIKNITFRGNKGSELSYSVYKRTSNESFKADTERINYSEHQKYYDLSEIIVSSEDDHGRIVLSGKTDSGRKNNVYEVITIEKDYVYKMTSTHPDLPGEEAEKMHGYMTETVYRMCGFSGSTNPARSYDEYLESHK